MRLSPTAISTDLIVVEIDPLASTQLFASYLGGGGNDTSRRHRSGCERQYLRRRNYFIRGIFRLRREHSRDSSRAARTRSWPRLARALLQRFLAQPEYSGICSVANRFDEPVATSDCSEHEQSAAGNHVDLCLPGDFAQSGNCGSSLSAAGSCTLSVTFTPSAVGARTGSIQSSDSGIASPQLVSLSGMGQGAVASFLPTSVTFASTAVGSTSSHTVTLTNQGNIALSISSVQVTGRLLANEQLLRLRCQWELYFQHRLRSYCKREAVADRLIVTSNAAGSPQTIPLSGTASDFSLVSPNNSATVQAGNTATYTVNVASVGGTFGNAVTLTCGGVPTNASCSISPSSVTPGRSNTVATTVTIHTGGIFVGKQPSARTRQQPYVCHVVFRVGCFRRCC